MHLSNLLSRVIFPLNPILRINCWICINNSSDDEEYETLYSFIEEYERDILNYQNTIAGIVANLIESLPTRAEEMQKIVDNFNPEKFQEVFNFAKAIK